MSEIQVVTIAWTGAAYMGAFAYIALVWDEWRSIQALKDRNLNGTARMVARHDLRTDLIALVIMLIQIVIGMTAAAVVFRGNPPRNFFEEWALMHVQHVVRYGLITAIGLAVVAGVWKRYDRRRLMDAVIIAEVQS